MEQKIKYVIFYFLPLCILLLLMGGCADDKFDEIVDNRYLTENIKKSNIRIINFDEEYNNQVIVNGDSLTNFTLRIPGGANDSILMLPSTKYFPIDGRLRRSWVLPQEVLDGDNKARVKLTLLSPYIDVELAETEFNVEDNGIPTDYYNLSQKIFAKGLPKIIAIPRSIEAPSKPDHFKIRLVNFAETPTSEGSSYSYFTEKLFGPMSLVYADGTTISDKLNGIDVGKYSEYVEVPYGTYQFKVLTEDGRQVPYYGSRSKIDRNTSSLWKSHVKEEGVASYLTFAPISVFKPGGIYTVVIFAQKFFYPGYADPGEADEISQNGCEIVEDIDPPVNTTYARIQFVNALPQDGTLTLRLNGKDIGKGVDFGGCTDYSSIVKGTYNLEVVDHKGEIVTSTNYDISAGDNYSAWLYNSTEGEPSLIVVFNDLSNSRVDLSNVDTDASLYRYKDNYNTKIRFLNLNADIPYATFTQDNGQPFPTNNNIFYSNEAASQLQPGYIYPEYPYIGVYALADKYSIMTYRANDSVNPGIWADDILPIQSTDLITRPELYEVRGKLPDTDVGVYTIALVGKKTDNEKYASKLMFVKHTK